MNLRAFPPSGHRRRSEDPGDMKSDLSSASDAVLAMAISRWREDALAEAYRRHAGPVFGLARRVLSDPARAEEVVQEVFLRLWNDPAKFDPDRGTLRTYLLAQAHGRAVDKVRSDVSRRRREDREAEEAGRHPGPRSIDDEVVDLIASERVREAVQSLPEEERKAIELAYFGGRSYREVAQFLETPEGTIKSRIRSGLGRLRHTLATEGSSEEEPHHG